MQLEQFIECSQLQRNNYFLYWLSFFISLLLIFHSKNPMFRTHHLKLPDCLHVETFLKLLHAWSEIRLDLYSLSCIGFKLHNAYLFKLFLWYQKTFIPSSELKNLPWIFWADLLVSLHLSSPNPTFLTQLSHDCCCFYHHKKAKRSSSVFDSCCAQTGSKIKGEHSTWQA